MAAIAKDRIGIVGTFYSMAGVIIHDEAVISSYRDIHGRGGFSTVAVGHGVSNLYGLCIVHCQIRKIISRIVNNLIVDDGNGTIAVWNVRVGYG